MIDNFLAYSKKNKLIQKGDKVLVGVSGGIDSVVLLDILCNVRKKLNIQIAVAHINYGLRKESDRDAAFVGSLAKRYDVPIYTGKMKLQGSNLEERARDIRYSFFNKILGKKNFQKIAVAHHKNDMVETFFLNAARGSGLTGLVSMRPKTESLIRPLLFATRSDIEDYAGKNSLKFVEDVTNKDLSIKRNLVRHKVIPSLSGINPDLVETIANEVENLRKAQDLLSEITEKYYKKMANERKSSVSLAVKDLQKLHPYLRSEVLRRSIFYVKRDLKNISRKNIESILKLIESTHGTKKVMLPGRLIASRTYDKLNIERRTKSPAKMPKKMRLTPGKELTFGKWRLFLEKGEAFRDEEDKSLVFLNIQKELKLLVRCRKPGDRITIGQGKTKSLQDIFVDAKIPQKERDAYPVIVNEDDEIIWIPDVRVSAPYAKVTKTNLIIKARKC
ncbi:tRNA lysidine(34) synthetase TilS [candidate division WS5 bacterium]|uniref:tRNA(Ile)-lysidine synthase n=1 Tax=candidate division WS5 bacterium TaxID=2093353 RepID=A0A419DGR3_9BACT|nr:MAG: tRNA lysidine(34) synthetase TilS [candidate division WS5 bacterium]